MGGDQRQNDRQEWKKAELERARWESTYKGGYPELSMTMLQGSGADQDAESWRKAQYNSHVPTSIRLPIRLIEDYNAGNQLPRAKVKANQPDGTYRKEGQRPEAASFTLGETPVFEPCLLPSVNPSGGRKYTSCPLNLSYELQQEAYELCKIAGVDYCSVLAIIAHESGSDPEKVNAWSGATGLMQITDTSWAAYNTIPDDLEKGSEYYFNPNDPTVQQLYEYVWSIDPNIKFETLEDMKNPLANIAVGIAHLYEHQKLVEKSKKCKVDGESVPIPDEYQDKYMMFHILAQYGEGVQEASTYELAYLRDILAAANGQQTWYIDDLYRMDGENLGLLYTLKEKGD